MSDDPQIADNEQAIEELIALGFIERGTKEHGIIRQWVSQGDESLSARQRYIFEQTMRPLMQGAECSVCREEIAFSDLPTFLEEGGSLCSYHRHSSGRE